MKSKSLVVFAILLTIAAIVGGVWFDRARSERKRAPAVAAASKTAWQPAPLPQKGELLPAGEGEASGVAKCGYCYWGEGGKTCNTVLQMNDAPGVVFLLPNEKREELEKLTGKCAGGNHDVIARGTITQYDGHNYMLVKNFEARKTK